MGESSTNATVINLIGMPYSLTATAHTKLVTVRVFFLAIAISFLYLTILFYAPNYRLLETLLTNSYPLATKLTLIESLFVGGLQAQSSIGLVLLILTAFLIGLNGALFIQRYHLFQKNGTAKIAVGGSMILGFVSTSCAVMCGFSLLPLIGATVGISFSVLDGSIFRVITITLLLISLFYTISSTKKPSRWQKTQQ